MDIENKLSTKKHWLIFGGIVAVIIIAFLIFEAATIFIA